MGGFYLVRWGINNVFWDFCGKEKGKKRGGVTRMGFRGLWVFWGLDDGRGYFFSFTEYAIFCDDDVFFRMNWWG